MCMFKYWQFVLMGCSPISNAVWILIPKMFSIIYYLIFYTFYKLYLIPNLHFFLWYWDLNSRSHTCWASALPLGPLHQPFFVLGIFEIGSCKLTFCVGWLQTVIILISASQIPRITGLSHWHPASISYDVFLPIFRGSLLMKLFISIKAIAMSFICKMNILTLYVKQQNL
jgi:hypothetical protein